MALFRKKNPDPISERAKALNAEIAALESQIKQLDSKLQQQPHPRLRSTAVPHGGSAPHKPAPPVPLPQPVAHEPVFEEVGRDPLETRVQHHAPPELFNEHGVRKYDLPAFLRRVKNTFQGPQTSNPRLVNYLAAGGVQGLRPLRYEKRVARNRFIALTICFLVLLTGILWWYYRTR
ncbi:MAG TPA: hypothetical protein PKA41_17950 [Verrucomicrobiota bacterium]|nr:hypothetical protein [Verrucomicrobiota bacterium]